MSIILATLWSLNEMRLQVIFLNNHFTQWMSLCLWFASSHILWAFFGNFITSYQMKWDYMSYHCKRVLHSECLCVYLCWGVRLISYNVSILLATSWSLVIEWAETMCPIFEKSYDTVNVLVFMCVEGCASFHILWASFGNFIGY